LLANVLEQEGDSKTSPKGTQETEEGDAKALPKGGEETQDTKGDTKESPKQSEEEPQDTKGGDEYDDDFEKGICESLA